jgi:single-stranded-DNA-specific exonuclease
VAEGYGLNMRIVSQAVEENTELLITRDNGIAAMEPIAYARELGITTIVTDHHEVPFSVDPLGQRCYHLPDADAIVNPKQQDCPYPYKGLCGAGVAYKVVQQLYDQAGIPDGELDELLTYAAIATVADVMDLTGENRIIVKYGLYLLKRTANVGLRALMSVTDVDPERLNAYHIGFVLGPCFNAAGRLRTVEMAFDLLLARDMETALPLALELKELNDSCKEMTTRGVERACEIIAEDDLDQMPVMVVYLPGTHESLAGIIAGRLREIYHHPIYVVVDGEVGLKASGRSIESYSMYEELQKCGDLLTRYGGHPMAAGLSLPEANLSAFIRRLNRNTSLSEEDLRPIVRIDAAVPIQMLSEEGIQELDLLEPFGKGNTKPLFAEQHFAILRARILGKNRNVLKMTVRNDAGCQMDAMYFGDIDVFDRYVSEEYGSDQLEAMYAGRPNVVDLGFVYYPSVNEFRGTRTLQIVVQHYCRIARK